MSRRTKPRIWHGISSQTLVQLSVERYKVDVKGIQPCPELDHVQSAHSTFNFADGGLATPQARGQVQLAQALRFTPASEHS